MFATKARAAQGKAGVYLAERAITLEAEVETSKQTLATALARDPAQRVSSGHTFVLASIGLDGSKNNEVLDRDAGMSEKAADGGASGGMQKKANVSGLNEAIMRAEISNRRASALW